MLCDYFTKLIFETLGVNKDEDIPMEKIKQTILDGGQNSELLSMFCGADLWWIFICFLNLFISH